VAVGALVTAATLVWAYTHPLPLFTGPPTLSRADFSILSFLGTCHPKRLRAAGKLAPSRANGLAFVAIWIAGP